MTAQHAAAAPADRVFFGWRVVAGSAVGLAFGSTTILLQTIGTFILPLTQEFGWTRTQVTGTQLVTTLAIVASAPLAGHLVDRYRMRWLAAGSAVLMGAGLASAATVNGSLVGLYLLYAGTAVVGCCTTPVIYTSIVTRWFDRRRGLALGVTLTGVGIGVTVMPALALLVIAQQGWRAAYLVLGLTTIAVAAPVVAWALRDRPADLGLAPDGDSRPAAASTGAGAAPTAGLSSAAPTFRSATADGRIWRLLLAFTAFGAAFGAMIVHLVPLLLGRGVAPATVAALLPALGLCTIAGRLLTGWLLDRVAPVTAAITLIVPAAAAIAVLTADLPVAALAVVVALIGLANGAEVDILSFMISRVVGPAAFGRVYAVLFAAFTLGGGLGSLALARVYDTTGSYGPGLVAVAAVVVAGCGVLATVSARRSAGAPAEHVPSPEHPLSFPIAQESS